MLEVSAAFAHTPMDLLSSNERPMPEKTLQCSVPLHSSGHQTVRRLSQYGLLHHDPNTPMTRSDLNVLGSELMPCSYDPLTGYFRDGCCNTSAEDAGTHVICAKVTQAFLDFSRSRGNDLITPRPEHRFSGLKAGDRWCLCALRWLEAFQAGVAPHVVLECTHQKALQYVTLEQLREFAWAPHGMP